MLTLTAADRGNLFRRLFTAGGAMSGYFTDKDLANAVGVGRNTVMGWWGGAIPAPETLPGLSGATGYDEDDLLRFLHGEGPIPRLHQQEDVEAWVRATAAERLARALPGGVGSEEPRAPHRTAGSEG